MRIPLETTVAAGRDQRGRLKEKEGDYGLMKGEGDGKHLDRLLLEDGRNGQRLRNSRKCQCPFVGLCWNMPKNKTLLDKPFHVSTPGSTRIRGCPTLQSFLSDLS